MQVNSSTNTQYHASVAETVMRRNYTGRTNRTVAYQKELLRMDFYQGVVLDYLRADRAVFINTECCIQLNERPNPDKSGSHWYCDAVAVDFRSDEVFLCEISYADKLPALLKRLREWSLNWEGICNALNRDCFHKKDWKKVRPWLFIPAHSIDLLVTNLEQMKGSEGKPGFEARITPLEKVQPWLYRSWNHRDCETDKPEVPEAYRS
jgi:hypothetical protein